MTFDDYLAFIRSQSDLLDATVQKGHTPTERVLARTVKMGEEVGELCDEVLSSIHGQRGSKAASHSKESIAREITDVMNTVCLLAVSMDVDILPALGLKAREIRAKHNPELAAEARKSP
jgi:NTP pyrophosphatase (non-canonical NTP hydrolase)